MSAAIARVREGMPHFALLWIGHGRLVPSWVASATTINFLLLCAGFLLRRLAAYFEASPVWGTDPELAASFIRLADLLPKLEAGVALYSTFIVGLWAARLTGGFAALPSSDARRRDFVFVACLGSAGLMSVPLLGHPLLWLATMGLAAVLALLTWAWVPRWPHPSLFHGSTTRLSQALGRLVGMRRSTIGRPPSRVRVVLGVMIPPAVALVFCLACLWTGSPQPLPLLLGGPMLLLLQRHTGERNPSLPMQEGGMPNWLPWSNAERARTNLALGIGLGVAVVLLEGSSSSDVIPFLPLFSTTLFAAMAATEALERRWRMVAFVCALGLFVANGPLFLSFLLLSFYLGIEGVPAQVHTGTFVVEGAFALVFAVAAVRFGVSR